MNWAILLCCFGFYGLYCSGSSFLEVAIDAAAATLVDFFFFRDLVNMFLLFGSVFVGAVAVSYRYKLCFYDCCY